MPTWFEQESAQGLLRRSNITVVGHWQQGAKTYMLP